MRLDMVTMLKLAHVTRSSIESHAANQAVKAFQVGNSSVATHVHEDWSSNNGYVAFFFRPAHLYFYQPPG